MFVTSEVSREDWTAVSHPPVSWARFKRHLIIQLLRLHLFPSSPVSFTSSRYPALHPSASNPPGPFPCHPVPSPFLAHSTRAADSLLPLKLYCTAQSQFFDFPPTHFSVDYPSNTGCPARSPIPNPSKHQTPFPSRQHQQVFLGSPGVHSRSDKAETRKEYSLTLQFIA